ncbi:PREDICTED: uncharacterized protein LOC108663658 [Theobroma cacao]|uniref:Uncharacterized protein LOC108663658 n=1 Tax=Theobroma cacao TaxID=3641 RepID=A0AB32X1U5_THECC|nr:PREDICTED: uncharacterized protein LOC108663658 [Theobroma cacao]
MMHRRENEMPGVSDPVSLVNEEREKEVRAISWNVRGFEKPEKRQAVKHLTSQYSPKFLFLQKTKLQFISDRMVNHLWGDGNYKWLAAHLEGSSRELISIWCQNFLQIDNFMIDRRFILVIGKIQGFDVNVSFVNIYAPTDVNETVEFWNDLLQVLRATKAIWCLGGDFNAEKILISILDAFPLTLLWFNLWSSLRVGLMDLPMSEGDYTWFNLCENVIFSKLDRFFLAMEFLEPYPDLIQRCLPASIFDHNPIMICLECYNWGPKPFRFYIHWLDDRSFKDMFISA